MVEINLSMLNYELQPLTQVNDVYCIYRIFLVLFILTKIFNSVSYGMRYLNL